MRLSGNAAGRLPECCLARFEIQAVPTSDSQVLRLTGPRHDLASWQIRFKAKINLCLKSIHGRAKFRNSLSAVQVTPLWLELKS